MNQLTQQSINLAAENQEDSVPGWAALAYQKLLIFAHFREDFITEDFRQWAEIDGLPRPAELRAYGSVIVRAVKSGAIVHTGEYRNMKNAKSHDAIKKVWRKVV